MFLLRHEPFLCTNKSPLCTIYNAAQTLLAPRTLKTLKKCLCY